MTAVAQAEGAAVPSDGKPSAGKRGGGAGGGAPKSIGHYVLMKTIGEGTFGKVKLGTHLLTGERVAVKVLEKERIVEIADVERVAREIHILKLIRKSRHIIQMYEIIETPKQLYLIMEYAPGGELFDYIVEHGRAEEKQACKFLHQILAGLEQIHSHNVVHRDLKPENLLLTDKKDIKIVDFGLSNTFTDGQLLKTACGSPAYAAPEMIQNQDYHPPAVDIWSCGVILFALVCGFLPFEDSNHVELYRKICAAEYEIPKFVSAQVADLIRGMLNTNPDKRLTLQQVQEHPWYKQIPEAALHEPDDCGALEEYVLDQLDGYGYPRDYSLKCLNGSKHNHLTTTYHLLKDRRLRELDPGDVAVVTASERQVAELDACFTKDLDEGSADDGGGGGGGRGGRRTKAGRGRRQAPGPAAAGPAAAASQLAAGGGTSGGAAAARSGGTSGCAAAARSGSPMPSARAVAARPAEDPGGADAAAGAPRPARQPTDGQQMPAAPPGLTSRGGRRGRKADASSAEGAGAACTVPAAEGPEDADRGGGGAAPQKGAAQSGAKGRPAKGAPQSARGQGPRWVRKADQPAAAGGAAAKGGEQGGPQSTPRAQWS